MCHHDFADNTGDRRAETVTAASQYPFTVDGQHTAKH